ncbi:MAG: flagellar motor switch protein FliN [Planctomycetota bacterium]
MADEQDDMQSDASGQRPDTGPDATNAALEAAQAAVNELNAEATAAGTPDQSTMVSGPDGSAAAGPAAGASPSMFAAPSFEPAESEELPKGLDLLSDVDVNVTIELGRTRMLVEDVLRLAEGAVVELDKLAGDPVDVFVNERLVARGEVLVLNDNFCIRVNEILDADTVEDD